MPITPSGCPLTVGAAGRIPGSTCMWVQGVPMQAETLGLRGRWLEVRTMQGPCSRGGEQGPCGWASQPDERVLVSYMWTLDVSTAGVRMTPHWVSRWPCLETRQGDLGHGLCHCPGPGSHCTVSLTGCAICRTHRLALTVLGGTCSIGEMAISPWHCRTHAPGGRVGPVVTGSDSVYRQRSGLTNMGRTNMGRTLSGSTGLDCLLLLPVDGRGYGR